MLRDLQLTQGKGFSEPDNVRPDEATADTGLRFFAGRSLVTLKKSAAGETTAPLYISVQLMYFRAAGALMEVVDILRDQCEMRKEFRGFCDGGMTGIGLYPPNEAAPPGVPTPDEIRILRESFVRRELLRIVFLPQPTRAAERRHAAFRRYTRTREHHDTSGGCQSVLE
jgi:hypothetical protein